jgi:hypothetical protein
LNATLGLLQINTYARRELNNVALRQIIVV